MRARSVRSIKFLWALGVSNLLAKDNHEVVRRDPDHRRRTGAHRRPQEGACRSTAPCSCGARSAGWWFGSIGEPDGAIHSRSASTATARRSLSSFGATLTAGLTLSPLCLRCAGVFWPAGAIPSPAKAMCCANACRQARSAAEGCTGIHAPANRNPDGPALKKHAVADEHKARHLV